MVLLTAKARLVMGVAIGVEDAVEGEESISFAPFCVAAVPAIEEVVPLEEGLSTPPPQPLTTEPQKITAAIN
jgi:hypothetical protein